VQYNFSAFIERVVNNRVFVIFKTLVKETAVNSEHSLSLVMLEHGHWYFTLTVGVKYCNLFNKSCCGFHVCCTLVYIRLYE